MENNVHITEIMNEYEALRTKAHQERDRRVAEIHAQVPALLALEQETNQIGFTAMKQIAKNPQRAQQYKDQLQEKLAALAKEKSKLLKEHKIPADYREVQYHCPACQDTGYVENQRCQCFLQKLINCAYADSNLSEQAEEQDFQHFSLDYYPERKPAGSSLTERELMQKVYLHCQSFCENFDTARKSMLFYGGTGVGKTFLSSAVAKEVLKQGKSVLYIRATRLFNLYDEYKFSWGENKSISAFYDADLLIIDDLGTEYLSKTSVPFLFDLVNDRLAKGKKMIISTNLALKDIEKAYTPRFVSRLYESFDILQFYGNDIRIEKFKKY